MKGKRFLHIHLPKPLHGWREFLGEVGIIVIGVLIALACEQVVEAWRWQERVAVVRKSMMSELANDRARWETDLVSARCLERELAAVNQWNAAPAGKAAPPFDDDVNLFWMHSSNWQIANSSQALDHFPIDEQVAIAALYDGVIHRQEEIFGLGDLATHVGVMLRATTDGRGRRDLQIATGELAASLAALKEEEAYMTRHFDAVGVKADRSDFAADVTNKCAA